MLLFDVFIPDNNRLNRTVKKAIFATYDISLIRKTLLLFFVVLDAELLSKFPKNWIVLRLEKITQYGLFIPDYS